jgi:hypothetical protein
LIFIAATAEAVANEVRRVFIKVFVRPKLDSLTLFVAPNLSRCGLSERSAGFTCDNQKLHRGDGEFKFTKEKREREKERGREREREGERERKKE